ncbi:MAG: ankyrin repeat domain-containing protein, partial [Pseudomonas aeruginosa]
MGKLNEQLIDAARVGNLEELRRLVQQGADLHTDDECALRLAASNGHFEVVKYLVEHRADIHTYRDQALRMAAGNGQ